MLDSDSVSGLIIITSSKKHGGSYLTMLKIGDFSKLSRVSIRMLRYYDEMGLLVPSVTDKFTGYRYYSEAQLVTVGRITALKDMGFSLSLVHNILSEYSNNEKLTAYLAEKRRELIMLSESTEEKLRLLDTALKRLRKDKKMNYNVTLKTLPERYAACVRMKIPKYSDEGLVWETLTKETAGMHLKEDDPCYLSVVFHDGEFKESDVDVEAQKTLKGCYEDTEHVKFRTLAPITFASATFKGGYELIGEVNASVAEWVNSNGYSFSGPMFNIYHVSPKDTSNPDEYVTEVCYPVIKK